MYFHSTVLTFGINFPLFLLILNKNFTPNPGVKPIQLLALGPNNQFFDLA